MTSECKFSRPSLDDIERISKGMAATKRGVGSRMVPHRLNNAGTICVYILIIAIMYMIDIINQDDHIIALVCGIFDAIRCLYSKYL